VDPSASDGYQDRCVTGEIVVIQGNEVRVPIPCTTGEAAGGGDPAPERQGRAQELGARAADGVAPPSVRPVGNVVGR
jgi:hypothetical protein